jgi:CheY-like chemotaxis protein
MPFAELARFVEDAFRHIAESKKLELRVRLEAQLPQTINTDIRRLQQIVKNLLSNAFKFTEKGSVELKAGVAAGGWHERCETLNRAETVIAFTVTDTGIGIPREKQQIIFEAFQQADAGTARKFGGTGLGLSISREIARLLGGSLHVESIFGRGSTFTLYLPAAVSGEHLQGLSRRREQAAPAPKPGSSIPAREEAPPALSGETGTDGPEDDRANIQPGDLVLLIIEDDRNFANVLVEFAREKKFKTVVARTAAQGITLAGQIKPSAITLDLLLPDNDGWMVLD